MKTRLLFTLIFSIFYQYVSFAEDIPYLTFHANDLQILQIDEINYPFEYSVNGKDWNTIELGEIEFGGESGDIRLRGDSFYGTSRITIEDNTISYDYLINFHFDNDTQVECFGDIRTLVNYDKYETADCSKATFCGLFNYCTQLISAPKLPIKQLSEYCYHRMFNHCTSLEYAPELPATLLADHCYEEMFSECTSLNTSPELSATLLADHCYEEMFRDCTSLISCPELPATILTESCYQQMFSGCTSLTDAPELPAKNLNKWCYQSMFGNCYNLLVAPDLPTIIMEEYCYGNMFNNCEKLTVAPKLPATTLAERCYSEMFSGCLSLKAAPELPAKKMAENCYWGMFAYCYQMKSFPDLPSTELAKGCYTQMFMYTNINTAPYLPATILAEGCYEGMFLGCVGLKNAPELLAQTLVKDCYRQMFRECMNVDYVKMMATDVTANSCLLNWLFEVSPTGTLYRNENAIWENNGFIPAGWDIIPPIAPKQPINPGIDNIPYLSFHAEDEQILKFNYIDGLECSINGKAWQDLNNININLTFGGSHGDLRLRAKSSFGTAKVQKSSNDTYVIEYMNFSFSNNTKVDCYGDIRTLVDYDNYQNVDGRNVAFSNLFWNCSQLTKAPDLQLDELSDHCYSSMFWGCSSLKEAPELPATVLVDHCYDMMFRDCTSLTSAPELPALSLAKQCYYMMFRGCSNLSYVKMLATQIDRDQNCYGWLSKVSPTGTFVKNDNATWNHSGIIPKGWNVETAKLDDIDFIIDNDDDCLIYSLDGNITSYPTKGIKIIKGKNKIKKVYIK